MTIRRLNSREEALEALETASREIGRATKRIARAQQWLLNFQDNASDAHKVLAAKTRVEDAHRELVWKIAEINKD